MCLHAPIVVIVKHGRNPFQGGMGISTRRSSKALALEDVETSQSLSGWDGDFHVVIARNTKIEITGRSQSLSGWDGDFHGPEGEDVYAPILMSQSLSGWDGDFHEVKSSRPPVPAFPVAIPFRVGWGFPHEFDPCCWGFWSVSQSLSGWDGDFHTLPSSAAYGRFVNGSQSLSGWDGDFHN